MIEIELLAFPLPMWALVVSFPGPGMWDVFFFFFLIIKNLLPKGKKTPKRLKNSTKPKATR